MIESRQVFRTMAAMIAVDGDQSLLLAEALQKFADHATATEVTVALVKFIQILGEE